MANLVTAKELAEQLQLFSEEVLRAQLREFRLKIREDVADVLRSPGAPSTSEGTQRFSTGSLQGVWETARNHAPRDEAIFRMPRRKTTGVGGGSLRKQEEEQDVDFAEAVSGGLRRLRQSFRKFKEGAAKRRSQSPFRPSAQSSRLRESESETLPEISENSSAAPSAGLRACAGTGALDDAETEALPLPPGTCEKVPEEKTENTTVVTTPGQCWRPDQSEDGIRLTTMAFDPTKYDNRADLRRDNDEDSEGMAATMTEVDISTLGRAELSWYRVKEFVKSPWFDGISCLLVVLNTIMIGVQVDWQAQHVTNDITPVFQGLGYVFCVVFTAELGLRMAAYKSRFFARRNLKWNVFDMLLVTCQITEEIMLLILTKTKHQDNADGTNIRGNMTIFRVVRILRFVRIVRVMRVLKLIGDLRTLVLSIMSSLKSLGWAVALLMVTMYIMGVYLTQVTLDHRLGLPADSDLSPILAANFGSVGDSVLLLYQAVTGGTDWGDVLHPLHHEVSVLLVPLFLFYIAFVLLCMLNVITGVFVESALLTARRDKDLYMVSHARDLFAKVDSGNDGTISWEEFERSLDTNEMREIFTQLDLDIGEALGLFQVLDTDRTGSIDSDEFITGCCRLRGPAKALDLNLLKMQSRIMFERFSKHAATVEKLMGSVDLDRLAQLLQPARADDAPPAISAPGAVDAPSPTEPMPVFHVDHGADDE